MYPISVSPPIQASTFRFTNYSWNHHAGKISLRYALDKNIDFEETILLPEPISDARLKQKEWEIERALMALHMIGGISYYKTCLPKSISVNSGFLSKAEAGFWNDVYEHGLGEFFYRNNIDFRGLIKFPISSVGSKDPLKNKISHVKSLSHQYRPKPINEQRLLVPIGGGKDSMVTVELLRKAGAKVTLLRMGAHPIIEELASIAGLPLLSVKRSLSGNLFDLNKQGALNGHVPITAYLSIVAVLLAILYDYDGVVMSNERSANEGNVEFKGLQINHQWSKSIDFEKAFRTFIADSIGSDVQYFSILRPFSELKIAEVFHHYPSYFTTATSCNKNWKILDHDDMAGKWCCECPKCAFVFAIYAAFLSSEDLKRIFGKILFDDPALIPLYKELLGVQNFKPFECVGTAAETMSAFILASKKKDLKKTPIIQMFEKEVLPTIQHSASMIEQCLKPNKEHCMPKEFEPLIA